MKHKVSITFRDGETRHYHDAESWATYGDLGLFQVTSDGRARLYHLDTIASIDVPVIEQEQETAE